MTAPSMVCLRKLSSSFSLGPALVETCLYRQPFFAVQASISDLLLVVDKEEAAEDRDTSGELSEMQIFRATT